MSPRNSEVNEVLYSVQKMLDQLSIVRQAMLAAWPPPPAQSNAPLPTTDEISAQNFARDFGTDATVEHAIALLKDNTPGAASFLNAASELLMAENARTKVAFDIQTQQETMEMGQLSAFVDFRLSNTLRALAVPQAQAKKV